MDVINKDLLEQLKEFQEEGASLKGEVDYRFLLF